MKILLLSPAACKNDSCLHGECVETINSHLCDCFEGFYGEKCDQGKKAQWRVLRLHYVKSPKVRTWHLTAPCFLCWQLLSATKKRWLSHIKEVYIALTSTETSPTTPHASIPVRKDTSWVCRDPWDALPRKHGQSSLLHAHVSWGVLQSCKKINSNCILTSNNHIQRNRNVFSQYWDLL